MHKNNLKEQEELINIKMYNELQKKNDELLRENRILGEISDDFYRRNHILMNFIIQLLKWQNE